MSDDGLDELIDDLEELYESGGGGKEAVNSSSLSSKQPTPSPAVVAGTVGAKAAGGRDPGVAAHTHRPQNDDELQAVLDDLDLDLHGDDGKDDWPRSALKHATAVSDTSDRTSSAAGSRCDVVMLGGVGTEMGRATRGHPLACNACVSKSALVHSRLARGLHVISMDSLKSCCDLMLTLIKPH